MNWSNYLEFFCGPEEDGTTIVVLFKLLQLTGCEITVS